MNDEERERRWAEREVRSQERRAEHDERRAERHRLRAEMHAHLSEQIGERVRADVKAALGRKRWYFGFGDMGVGAHAEAIETIEKRFEVAGAPLLRVSNVSGETDISVGDAREVLVRARKRIRGWSEERAKRLLENVEIRMEQDGNEIRIEPRLFEQERGWLDLFRGGRVAVDLDIRVPRETAVEASTVSGDLSITGTRGQHEVRSVSGDVTLDDVQGPALLRTASGDVSATAYAGRLEANSTSGDIEIRGSRVRTPDVVTVSGNVDIRSVALPADGGEGRVKTVSGDIEIAIAAADAEVEYQTVSGDTLVEIPALVEKHGRRARRIVIGKGGPRLRVKSVSGDLRIPRAADEAAREEEGAATPMSAPPEPPPPPAPSAAGAREILERLARGHLQKFGIDLDELPKEAETAGRIVDISKDEDRVEIFVE
ncbi:MAG: DUF4097 domain-containing protein [Chloroflexi bacterium]|nr:DUF4097 domain-containing protein [Chloroflexota bacterium]